MRRKRRRRGRKNNRGAAEYSRSVEEMCLVLKPVGAQNRTIGKRKQIGQREGTRRGE
jgi:hypothetical protein